MSNEYKLLCCPFCGELPIITKHHREEMYAFMHRCEVLGPIGRDFREDPMSHVEMWNTRVAAAPQPPALGGEFEVVGWRDNDGRCVTHGGSGRYHNPLIDLEAHRAHLAPLQAEIERLKYELNCANGLANLTKGNLDEAKDEIDQLKARCDELEETFRKLQDVAQECERNASYCGSIAALSKPAGSEQV